ncbi:tRNA (5-methylaminomethyl-2-thiouridylate)-methyltransferase [Desulfonispora thiosulfatigenes DSM 11270]|uniref:tRNA-specific 2-thiouridylase MnmA n=1 Tax=Desulfonispora thiosulfatigenes DSM 11270 TaxID=656914 RepID=A0A1W1VQX8_DESTI|nr:tRNA 2-thiouridine(34) synthase MnmA [Desulfonispora thiosulfatigenes]SMB95630.1 tRNA (5-methylaminomethyl-2-thiouridylate)-methyltransferase [Desulfonispora thiosulfatigenes DSM 11270]
MKNQVKVALAMSGGVDSSVAAHLLLQEGYDVIGVTFKLWPENDFIIENAKEVADKLNIPLHVFDFQKEFNDNVVESFKNEYLQGRTPNPCIECNKNIKFNLFLQQASKLGADIIATGHYARIEWDESFQKYLLKTGLDPSKDQSYFLYNLTQEELSKTIFPLGNYTKNKIKEIATQIGLSVAQKPESQEICFIPDNDYREFLYNHVDNKLFKKGNFLDTKGKVIGTHQGISFYTIGQRKNLGLSLGYPAYVVDIDVEKNAVVIGDNEDVFKSKLVCNEYNLIHLNELTESMEVEAKIRYGAKLSKATISPHNHGAISVKFREEQRAITKGQAVVFYNSDVVLGGGKII